MTDMIKGFVVTLENNIREDDCAGIAEAIRQLRGVCSVRAEVADLNHHLAAMQIRHEVGKKLWEIIEGMK